METSMLAGITQNQHERDIESYENDIDALLKIRAVYNDDVTNLCGGYASDMLNTIDEQIEFCKSCIKNLEK